MPNSEVISISDDEEDSARDEPHMDEDSEGFYGEDEEEIDELDSEEYAEAVPPQRPLMLRIPARSRVVADHARPVKSRSHEQAERHSSPDQHDVVYNAPRTPPNRKRQRSPITPGGPVRKHRARDTEEHASQVAQSADHPLHKYLEEMRRDEESDEEVRRSMASLSRRSVTSQPSQSTRTPVIKGEDSASASQPRRKPGRPSKPRPPELPQAPAVDPKTAPFTEMLHLEVQLHDVLVKGRTPRGDKMKSGGIWKGGPVQLTNDMTWQDFLGVLAEGVHSEIANLDTPSMAWRWNSQSSQRRLALTNEVGFTAMTDQIRAFMQKNKTTLLEPIMIHMTEPRKATQNLPPWSSTASSTAQNQSQHLVLDVNSAGGAKLSLDQQLRPIVERLDLKYPKGLCAMHPTLKCFHYQPNNWHFELTSTRLSVWASSILKNLSTDDNVPIGSACFRESDNIRASKSTNAAPAAMTNTPVVAQGMPSGSGAWPSFSFPGMPPAPGFQHPFYQSFTPYGYPFSSPAQLPFPSPPHPNSPYPQQPQAGPSNERSYNPPSSPITFDSAITVDEWCAEMGLGDNIASRLHSLGFQPGDNLSDLPDDMWKDAGFLLLEWKRVVRAAQHYRNRVRDERRQMKGNHGT